MKRSHSTIETIPMSTDARKIEFFGTLMPALLLLKSAPLRFLGYQIAGHLRPRGEIDAFIAQNCDDAARIENTLVFVHRWESTTFDPFTFARAKTFIRQLRRMLLHAGYSAALIDPLSPGRNLPKLAQSAKLGNLSPYGLLVHRIFWSAPDPDRHRNRLPHQPVSALGRRRLHRLPGLCALVSAETDGDQPGLPARVPDLCQMSGRLSYRQRTLCAGTDKNINRDARKENHPKILATFAFFAVQKKDSHELQRISAKIPQNRWLSRYRAPGYFLAPELIIAVGEVCYNSECMTFRKV